MVDMNEKLKEIKKIINNTKTNKLQIIPKFGLQFFYSKNGRAFLQNFKRDYFLDLKINDIPQTALSAMDSLKDLKKCKYITVHVNGGFEMLKAITKKAKSINKNLKVLGVTILTSLNKKSLEEIIKISANDKTKIGIFNNAAQVWNHTFYFNGLRNGSFERFHQDGSLNICGNYYLGKKIGEFIEYFKSGGVAKYNY